MSCIYGAVFARSITNAKQSCTLTSHGCTNISKVNIRSSIIGDDCRHSFNALSKQIVGGKVYTAACVGTVLPGVTRRSCIELLQDWGYEVIEGKLAIEDIMKAGHEGTLEEVFGTGTAAVVSPVKELDWKGDKVFISEGKIGPVTQKLYDTMTGIQWGKLPDEKGWIVPVCKG